jgi:ribonuclease Z
LNNLTARSFEVEHRGFALGYELTYQRQAGRFLPERAEEFGIPRGPLWRMLASGREVTLDDGRVIRPEDVTLQKPPATKVVYSGDTRPCETLMQAAKSADLFICEAMFSSEHQNLAEDRGHMTGVEAAKMAVSCGVKSLILTHLSPRYDMAEGISVLKEAQAVFPDTILARDLMRVRVDSTGAKVLHHDITSALAEVPPPDDESTAS